MKSKFKCLHSGKCCELTTTQINLSFGDVLRLSEHSGMDVKELFDEGVVGLQPFPDPENPDKFDIELGLNIPCHFRVDKRCTAYEGRPLNCRIFPYYIISKAPREKWKEIFDGRYKCIHTVKIDEETKKNYEKYADEVGEIIMRESEVTDKTLQKLGLRNTLTLTSEDEADAHEMMEYKINLSKSLGKKLLTEGKIKLLVKEIEKFRKDDKFVSIEEVESFNKYI